MDELLTKKMAEIQAFIDIGATIASRGGVNFRRQAPDIYDRLEVPGSKLSVYIDDERHARLFRTKAEMTRAKLTTLMELYVGENWDDPVEVLEWLSFYAGAASSHAQLVSGRAQTLNRRDVHSTGVELADRFWGLLEAVRTELGNIGEVGLKKH